SPVTLDLPDTLARLSDCQATSVPTPPRIASSVALAACCCSLQSRRLMIASDSIEPTEKELAMLPAAPPKRPRALSARPPSMLPNTDLLALVVSLHFCCCCC